MELRVKDVKHNFQFFGMNKGDGTLRNEKTERGAIFGEKTSGHDELRCL